MSKRAMMAMARRNPVTNRMLWITGLAVGAAALVGGVAYAATRKSGGGGAGPTPRPTTPTGAPTGTPAPTTSGAAIVPQTGIQSVSTSAGSFLVFVPPAGAQSIAAVAAQTTVSPSPPTTGSSVTVGPFSMGDTVALTWFAGPPGIPTSAPLGAATYTVTVQ
jgi:hypothetical protein